MISSHASPAGQRHCSANDQQTTEPWMLLVSDWIDSQIDGLLCLFWKTAIVFIKLSEIDPGINRNMGSTEKQLYPVQYAPRLSPTLNFMLDCLWTTCLHPAHPQAKASSNCLCKLNPLPHSLHIVLVSLPPSAFPLLFQLTLQSINP